jgi:type III pantothenate kinase
MDGLLAIDQGNTRLKAGIFHRDRLVRKDVFLRPSARSLTGFIGDFPVSGIIVSSVGKPPEHLLKTLQKIAPLTNFSSAVSSPIINRYKTPETLGADRLAAVVGAASLFPKRNILVIDAGTCITYDFHHKTRGYLGGSITPGISLRLKSLHEGTRRLPLVKLEATRTFTGNDTRTSILTGCLDGAAMEANGFVSAYRKKYGPLTVVLTGGDAPLLSKRFNFSIFDAPDLVLYGLNATLRYVLGSR